MDPKPEIKVLIRNLQIFIVFLAITLIYYCFDHSLKLKRMIIGGFLLILLISMFQFFAKRSSNKKK